MRKGREKTPTVSSFPFWFSVSRTHPGLNLLTALSLVIFVLTIPSRDWIAAIGLWIVTLTFSFIASLHPGKNLLKMAGILPFLCLALLFHAFFTPGTILLHIGPLYVTRDGLAEGAWITQKLALFFFLSFLITSSVSSLFIFQLMARARRLPLLRRLNLHLWIIALFLILQWLRILPTSWSLQVSEVIKGEPSRIRRTLKGLGHFPLIFRDEIKRMGRWSQLLVLRGYAEGVLILSQNPLPALKPRHLPPAMVICLAWVVWLYYIL